MEKVGSGLYKVKHCLDEQTYLVKKEKFSMKCDDDFRAHPTFMRTTKLAGLEHPNIGRYFDTWIELAHTGTNNKFAKDTLELLVFVQLEDLTKDYTQAD